MAKPKILTLIAYYLPGHKAGGPIRTIANMVDRLGDELDIYIITADRDARDIVAYSNVGIDGWNTVGKAKVFYASPGYRSLGRLAQVIRDTPHDVLYLNSFFSPVFTMRPLLARRLGLIPKRPTVVAPRGEFSQGALALKRWKKRCYLAFAQAFGLYRDITWQASSQYEVEDIRRVMGAVAQQIEVAPNVPAGADTVADDDLHDDRAPGAPLRVCFLSRISPKKNLDYAIRVLAKVKVPVDFNIYGAVSDESYWQQCQALAKELPHNVVVHYHGAIDHADVPQALATQDLFFFPTRGENYGHVIHEALSSGLPVLISDQTPWRDLQSHGMGWDLPLSSPQSFCEIIEAQALMDRDARVKQRKRIQEKANLVFDENKTLSDNLSLFIRIHEAR